jgi:hypothetical protein
MINFDEWWAKQNQTIGKVAAKAAWDYLMEYVPTKHPDCEHDWYPHGIQTCMKCDDKEEFG